MFPTIIAEAGVNHNGDLARASEMVHAAAESGADLVKFQAFSAAGLVAGDAATAAYQRANTGARDQRALLRGLELGLDDFTTLAETCRAAGVGFLCTSFDSAMVRALVALGMPWLKVASGELTNSPALRALGAFDLPVLLSTGMATEAEVATAIGHLRAGGVTAITLLHCTSLYPAPYDTVNLRAMVAMADRFDCPVGYSDHTGDDQVTIAAVALGARVIEKHFTLSRALPGPDHAASLEPQEFAVMVERLRAVVAALGDGVKRPAPGEAAVAALVRRSWHAARALPTGTTLMAADVVLKRPAGGLVPDQSPVGRRLLAEVAADESITADMIA
ncbi:MAG: N-acetylneuraminate synthase family protein [Alphaproteobacteria bacterium]|nr:N-acetylneuraminate synthase family protein [Alphaproteobacteria bacterium]